VMRKPAREDDNDSDNGDETGHGQPTKKTKKGSDSDLSDRPSTSHGHGHGVTEMKHDTDPTMAGAMALQSLQKSNSSDEGGEQRSSSFATGSAALSKSSATTASKSSTTKYTHGSTGSDANTSEDSNKPRNVSDEDEGEEEYVCVIRPADVSVPPGSSVCFQTYLSTASMVEHDRKRDVNNNATNGHTQTDSRGSPSCSVSGSNDSGSHHSGSNDKLSNNKVSTTTGTSSETGSEEGSA